MQSVFEVQGINSGVDSSQQKKEKITNTICSETFLFPTICLIAFLFQQLWNGFRANELQFRANIYPSA